MSKLFFEILATIKGNVSKETLSPPDFTVSKADAESVEIEIIRRDIRGEVLRWEISADENFQNVVEGIDLRSGTILDSGTVVLENNGNPIDSFYLRVRDTNSPTYNDGIQGITFVGIEEARPLNNPEFTLTPLIDSVLVNVNPVVNATRYILEISEDNNSWTEVTDNYPIGSQPFEVIDLEEDTVYYFRVTSTSDSLLFKDSFSVLQTETLEIPTLPSPTDLTFEDLGSGTVGIGVTYAGVSDVNYVIERNNIQVYSGSTPSSDVSGFVNATAYTIRAKVQKFGYNDSEWYFEVYSHQTTPEDYLTLEQFGGQAYYKRIDEGLNYTNLNNGTTRITYTGVDNVFDSEDVGKSFCGLYAHKNPDEPDPNNINLYYPTIEGSRYSKVLSVENGKNIIVDFEYNLNKTNWAGYVFFDNSKAYSDCVKSLVSGDLTQIRVLPNVTYVITEDKLETISGDKDFYIFTGTNERARIKKGYEDYFSWTIIGKPKLIDQSGANFRLLVGSGNFVSHNIDWISPHRFIVEATPFRKVMFSSSDGTVGIQSRIIAVVNCNTLAEKEEISNPLFGNFPSMAIGTLYSGGTYSGSGINQDVSDYMHVLVKNYQHRGMTFSDLKANNGGGIYLVAEDVNVDTSEDQDYIKVWQPCKIKVTTNKSGFDNSITSRSYYPTHVFELSSSNSWFQAMGYATIRGWSNRNSCVQIGKFAFWLTTGNFWKTIYEHWYNRGNAKRSWSVSDQGSDHITSKKIMMHTIPIAGQTYTVGRSYSLSPSDRVIPTSVNYRKSRIRGNINWSLVHNKRFDLINPTTEIPENSIPLDFQPGDRFTIVGQGPTIYEVIRTDKMDSRDLTDEPIRWGSIPNFEIGYFPAEFYLDKDLPDSLGLTFEINVLESKAQILLDGNERDAYMSFKGNSNFFARDIFLPSYNEKKHDKDTTMLHGNIVASNGNENWSQYNHEECTLWVKNFVNKGFYRESNNGNFGQFNVTNPATGQVVKVSSLRKYSKGYTMINSSGYGGQFGPESQFELRDLIRKSQSINLPENEKEKLRMYNCTDMGGRETQVHPYIENYPDDSGAPDMPTVCRDLLNSLP